MKIRRSLYIFLPPLIMVLWWFSFERSEFEFLSFQLKAEKYDPTKLEKLIGKLPQISEEMRDNAEPVKFTAENTLKDVSKAVNLTVMDKLGYFAELPIHEACLMNRNRITSEGEPIESISNIGAIGIVPKNNQSLNFYAEVGEKDCKPVFKKDFEAESFNPPEYAYPILRDIGPEDLKKIYKGEKYEIYLREVTIDAKNSRFIIRLNYTILAIVYLILILIWSPIYFQIRKITFHIRCTSDKS